MAQPHINEIQAVDPILTNMLVGYMQSDFRFLAGRLFPSVPVDKDSGTYYLLDKKYWFLDEMQERAPGAPFPESGYGVSTATYTTKQYALQEAIPDENRRNSQLPMELESISVSRLAQMLLIRKERDLASKFFTTGVWGTDDDNATTDWDDFAAGDPVKDVMTAKRTISNNTGYDGDTLAVGYIVHEALTLHPDIIDRIKYVQVADQRAIELAIGAIFEVDYMVSKASWNSANEGQTFSAAAIVDDDALVVHKGSEANMFSASAGKTFVWDGGGGEGAIYRWRDGKNHRDLVQMKAQFTQNVVASDLGYFFANVV